MTKTNKTGVYYNLLEDGDKVFYFTYADINDNKKKKWVKVGNYSNGMREATAFTLRAEQISKMTHGEDITVIANKKKVNILTFDDIAKFYFEDKKVDKYRISKYNLHIKPIIGNKSIDNITKDMIEKNIFNGELLKDKAPQTINGIRELIGAIFNYSIKNDKINIRNPLLGVKRLKVDNDRERYLSLQEVKLLKSEAEHNLMLSIFVNLALDTGARVESILHLTKKDFNLPSETVTIKNFKTNDTYTGFLRNETINQLKELLHKLKVNDFVITFCDNHEIKSTHRMLQHRLKPILDRLFNVGLAISDTKNRVVIHTLRHTFASHLAINSVPIFTIQKLMNHQKIEQTMRYAKLSPENGKNAVQGLYK
ncbi:MAG: site-specific integrase [Arcobacteraceae bacterium]|jgi:integrase|nr:site-specific integrase [Arcobacteraceae bacterium]